MIIGLAGYARSGKDTVADYLVQKYGFTKKSFADPMREALRRLDPAITVGELSGVSLSNAVDKFGWEALKSLSPDVRPLLQRMGTEVGREMFGEDFWVLQALQSVTEDRVVFSDVRFRNEAYRISRDFGYNWRIVRPGVVPANGHASENDLDDYRPWDAVIENDKDVDYLYSTVDKLMKEYLG